MSNSKIRSWIYRAAAFLILVGIAWFFLLRESKISKDSLAEIYSVHQNAFENVQSYLLSKDADVDITDLPTIDNSFNIPHDDSQAYRDFCDGLYELMETEVSEVIAQSGTVRFVTHSSGGLLVKNHAEIACGDAPITIKSAPRDTLTDGNWYYYIIKED